ncbi:MAG: spermidine/putrescine ABC transporter substrate-binding protein [Deinococcota bacterium]
MKKVVCFPIAFAMTVLALAGLLSSTNTAAAQWACPAGFEGQTLSVYNWTTYIAEDTIGNFEKLCSVEVTYDTFPTDTDMLARIRQGNPGYDIVVPSQETAELMIAEDLLMALNFDNIPNFANIIGDFKNPAYDPDNAFTVPYQWGTIGIGYNTNAFEDPITSWQDMFEHDGPVSWIDDNRGIIGIALVILGYDPNTSDADEINEARDFLIANGANVTYINQDDGQEVLIRGEADVVVEYNGDIFQIIDECECDDYAYVLPDEGTIYWVDTLAIPTDAPNQALAEVFIDYVLDAQVGADISNYTAYASPNAQAIDDGLIEESMLTNPGIYPSDEILGNLFTIVSNAEMEQLYNDAWDEIRILIGQ